MAQLEPLGLRAGLGLPVAQLELPELRVLVALLLRGGCMRDKGMLRLPGLPIAQQLWSPRTLQATLPAGARPAPATA